MKTEEERPNARTAWSLTVGAIFAQMSFVFSIGAVDVEGGFLLAVLLAVSGAGLSLFAISEWKKYFEALMRYEIQSHSKG